MFATRLGIFISLFIIIQPCFAAERLEPEDFAAISEFADKMCGNPPIEGSSEELKINLKSDVELDSTR